MNKKLYIGNLPYSATAEEIRALFEQVGEISDVAVISDRETGRSKGFGFVEMSDNGQAQAAIQALNLKEVDGRCLTVNEARPREAGGGGRW